MNSLGTVGVVLAVLAGLYAAHLHGKISKQEEIIEECGSQIEWANAAISEGNKGINEVKDAKLYYQYQDVQYAIDNLQEQYPVSNPCTL